MASLNPKDYTAEISQDPNDYTDVGPSLNPDDYTAAPPAPEAALPEAIPAPGATATQPNPFARSARSFARGVTQLAAAIPEDIAIAATKLADATGVRMGQPATPRESSLYKVGQSIRGIIPPETGGKPSFLTDTLPQAFGSGIGFIAGGVAGKALKVPALISTAGLGAAATAAEGYQDAISHGANEDTAFQSFLLNAGLGLTEAVPFARLVNRLTEVTGGEFKRQFLKAAVRSGIEEAIQETVQQTGSNAIAAALYDPDRPLFADVPEGAAAGGIVGFTFGLLAEAVGGRRVRVATPEREPDATTTEQQQSVISPEPDGRDAGRPPETPGVGGGLQRPAPGQEAPSAQQGQGASSVDEDLAMLQQVVNDEKQKAVDRSEQALRAELDRLDQVESEQQQQITERRAQQQRDAESRAKQFADLVTSVPDVEPSAAPMPQAPIVGVGSVYESTQNGQPVWLVQEREKRGFGDTIWKSQAEAVSQSKNLLRRQAERAESEERDKVRKAEDERLAKEKADFDGFETGKTPMQIGRLVAALSDKQVNWKGIVSSRRDAIRRLVESGRTVEVAPSGKRRLIDADGNFFGEDQTSKIGMDYAEYLISQRTQPETPAALNFGDPVRIMGVDSVFVKGETIDGVRYELFAGADSNEWRATIRVTDVDTGTVVTLQQHPAFYLAEDKFNEAVQAARRSSEKPAPDQTPPSEETAVAPTETGIVDTIAGRMGLVEFERKGYAPEQVTRQNWIDLQRAERRRLGQPESGDNPNAPWVEYENFHRDSVKAALSKGEEVDSEVLKDYPDLQPAPEVPSEPSAESTFGFGNTIFTEDVKEAALRRLREKLKRTNAGIDPTLFSDAVMVGGYYAEGGVRKFSDWSARMIEDVGEGIRPYLEVIYRAVRDWPGFDSAGMDSDEQMNAKAAASTPEPAPGPQRQTYYDALIDLLFSNQTAQQKAIEIRRLAKQFNLTPKTVQEQAEAELVRWADAFVRGSEKPRAVFDRFINVYNSQPVFSARTSTSVENQAYSTPLPLAYALSHATGVNVSTSMYEPTAGNGMLMIGSKLSESSANELNRVRAAELRALGVKTVTENDATQYTPRTKVDIVHANPPFGTIPNVNYGGYGITKLEHLISLRALEAMDDDGTAALILGARREAGEGGKGAQWIFENYVYGHYNVVENFEVDGDLYSKQGAKWPVRILVIAGRRQNPIGGELAPKEVERLSSWEQIWSKVTELRNAIETRRNNLDPEGIPQPPVPAPAGGASTPGPGSVPPGTKPSSRPPSGGRPGGGGGVRQPTPGTGSGGGVSGLPSNRPSDEPTNAEIDASKPDGGGKQTPRMEVGRPPSDQAAGDGGRGSEGTGGGSKPPDVARRGAVSTTDFQVPYVPRSEGNPFETLTPKSIADGEHAALDALRTRVGAIDEFVAGKLNMEVDELRSVMAAEQIDGVALAIDQIETGGALIVGDETGIGKGRQGAAIIRYAILNGKIPIFFTKDPKLFSDMYGDLSDIHTTVKPLIMGNPGKASIVDQDGKRLVAAPGAAAQKSAMRAILENGMAANDYNAIFATYSQVRDRNARQQFLEELAEQNPVILILDEAHEAAGDLTTSMQAAFMTGGQVVRGSGANRTTVTVPGLLRRRGANNAGGGGVLYLSATYAKRSENMPVYFRTSLSRAARSFDLIVDAMRRGGVALQQAVSEALAKAGQYVRRERDFAGTSYDMVPVKVKDEQKLKADVDQVTDVLSEIVRFSQTIRDLVQGSTAQSGAQISMTDFASIVHNQVGQLLLGAKADAVVEMAVQAHKRGEKPLVALMNTMESFLDNYTTDSEIKPGDPIQLRWNELLKYALSRTLRVSEEQPNGDTTIRTIDPDEYGLGDFYRQVQALADEVEVPFPISPIDYIIQKLDRSGVKMAELTGRKSGIEYTNFETGDGIYRRFRKANKNTVVNGFNGGAYDGMLLNASGSTGLSAHASVKVKDQKPRHMLIAQPALDINVFVQTLGRIRRTGMVLLGVDEKGRKYGARYSHLVLPLQAELRPAAMAARKMKSLNANTTAEADAAVKIQAEDIFNRYGDAVVAEFLDQNHTYQQRTGIYVSTRDDGTLEYGRDIGRKFTGRIAMLSDSDQKFAYENILSAYREAITRLKETGEYDLEIVVHDDWDGVKLESQELIPPTDASNIFTAGVNLEQWQIKDSRHVPNGDEIMREFRNRIGSADKLRDEWDKFVRETDQRLDREIAEATQLTQDPDPDKARTAQNTLLNLQRIRDRWNHTSSDLAPIMDNAGRVVEVTNTDTQDSYVGMLVDFKFPSQGRFSPAAFRLRYMVNSPSGMIYLNGNAITGRTWTEQPGDTPLSELKSAAKDARYQRYFLTGNPVEGFNVSGGRGKLVRFLSQDGDVITGILMPNRWQPGQLANDPRVQFTNGAAVSAYVRNFNGPGLVETTDLTARIGRMRSGGYSIHVASARSVGGRVYLDERLRQITGDFTKTGGRMVATIIEPEIAQAAERISQILNVPFRAVGQPGGLIPLVREANGQRQSKGQVVDSPISKTEASRAVTNILGKMPSNITFINDADAPKGQVTFTAGQLPQIEINLAKHDSPDGIKDTLIHELLHPVQEDPAMAGAVDAVARLVSEADRARKAALGYNADETQIEATNELIRMFYVEYANSNIFQRAITSVVIATKRLFGIDLTARQAAIFLVRDAVRNRASAASGEGMARVEEDDTAEDDDLTATQVQGVPMGVLREVEHLKPIVEDIRTSIFDSTKPVTDERTDDARDIFARFVDPNAKGQEASAVRAQLGNVDAGPALVLTELWRYAEKMAIAGDPSLLREMIPHYQTFALLGEAGSGATTVGRALRALQETGTLFGQLYQIEKANAELAGRELGVGPELMERLLDAIMGIQLSPDTLAQTLEASQDMEQAIEGPMVQAIAEMVGLAMRQGKTVDVKISPQEQVNLQRRIMAMFPQARYRKFYTEKGADQFVEDFFRLMSGKPKDGDQEGHIWTADRLLMRELRRLLLQKAAAMGIKPKSKDPANLYDQIVQVLGKGELRRNKIELFDKLVRAEIESQQEAAMKRAEANEDEDAAQRIFDAATSRAEMLLDAWNEIIGTLSAAPASETMLRRVIADQFKKLSLTWEKAMSDSKVRGRVIEFALRDIQDASSERKLGADFPALDLSAMRQALELEFDRQLHKRQLRQQALEQKKAERLAAMMAQRPEREAKRLLDSLEKSQIEWLKPEDRKTVQKVIAEFLKTEPPLVESQFVEPLAERLKSFGAEADTATQLATEIYRREMNRWSAARVRMMNRASLRQSVASLVESIQSSPYRAQSDSAWRRRTAMDWFMASGLSREQAEAATGMFEERFNVVLAKAREAVARRVLAGEPVTTIERAIAAIRSGVLDPSQPWSKEFAKKAGITPATPEQFKRLAELDEQYSQEGLSLPEKELLVEQMSDIFRQLNPPPGVMTRLAANYVATLLTGIPTTTINIFAPVVHLFSERVLRSIANPTDIRTAWRGLSGAWSNWLSEAKFTVSKDAFSFLGNDFQSANNVLKTVWEEGLRDIKSKSMATRAKGLYNILRGSQQYSMRFLNATDQANMIAEREAQTVLYGSSALKQFGFGVREVDMFVQSVFRLKQEAYQDGIDRGLDPNLARVRADSIVIEQLEASLADKIGDTEAAKVVRAAELDAYNITGRLATKEGSRKLMRETDEGGLLSRTILHPLLEFSSKLRKKEGFGPALGVALLGYLNVPLRTARFYAWNSPYGLLRMGVHKWRKARGLPNLWNQTLANEYQEQHRLKMAITSTVVMGVLAALGKSLFKTSDDDDDKDGIFITGKGPKNKQLRDAWTRQGFSANGIYLRIDGRGIRLPLERLGEPLAHMFWPLAARDDYAWRKREAESAGRPFDEAPAESTGYAIGSYMALLGQRGLIQQLTRLGSLGSDQGGQSKILAAQAAQMVSASVTPYVGLQNSVDRLFNATADRSSIEAAVSASFPILGVFGDTLRKRQVNRFGDPLYDQSWFAKSGTLGIPVAVRVANTPDNQRLYETMIRSGAAPPELRRYLIEEKYGPLTEDQWQQFALRSGRALKQETLARLPELESLPREDAKRLFQKLGSAANNATALAMGLDRVNAPEPRTRTAAAPARPAATLRTSRVRRGRTGRVRGRTARHRRPRVRSIRLPRSTTRMTRIRSRRRPRLRYS